ncbi:uncharacterized protein EI90DRAFT_2666915 [Cantharellus anzutake]|uniref:uncharacterized protein n=1 Tax=Cantharellus anzutake TaxID=1750568 RepID=UPI001908619A|nr:uncharacterized protein EI90DRAFT_2666915 [Cantharellus anzutake]KAF8337578.1 hypothetical protein EI90DRAFT_2666915 [Cantharellus anzutake]
MQKSNKDPEFNNPQHAQLWTATTEPHRTHRHPQLAVITFPCYRTINPGLLCCPLDVLVVLAPKRFRILPQRCLCSFALVITQTWNCLWRRPLLLCTLSFVSQAPANRSSTGLSTFFLSAIRYYHARFEADDSNLQMCPCLPLLSNRKAHAMLRSGRDST